MEPIILASSSPRRQEILKMLNIPFKVILSEYDEKLPEEIKIEDAPEFFASQKVNNVVRMLSSEQCIPWVLGADTMIILDGKAYGKPKDNKEAEEFLKTFSGRTHEVITSIALFNGSLHYLDTKVSRNKVTFARLTPEEIEWYINSSEWHGVAGGYRLQGLASCFIRKIEGSWSSIVGLPIFELYDILREQGYSVLN